MRWRSTRSSSSTPRSTASTCTTSTCSAHSGRRSTPRPRRLTDVADYDPAAARHRHDARRVPGRRHPHRRRRTSATPVPTCCATASSTGSPATTRWCRASIDEGRLTADEACDHPRRSVLIRTLQDGSPAEPDLFTVRGPRRRPVPRLLGRGDRRAGRRRDPRGAALDVAEPADAVDRLIAPGQRGRRSGQHHLHRRGPRRRDRRRTRADSSSARRRRRRPRPEPTHRRPPFLSVRRASLVPWCRRRSHPALGPGYGLTGVLGLVGAGAALAALVAVVLTTVVNGPVDVVPGLSAPDRSPRWGCPRCG